MDIARTRNAASKRLPKPIWRASGPAAGARARAHIRPGAGRAGLCGCSPGAPPCGGTRLVSSSLVSALSPARGSGTVQPVELPQCASVLEARATTGLDRTVSQSFHGNCEIKIDVECSHLPEALHLGWKWRLPPSVKTT